ncbi:MAG: type II toxin-antitoxin system RelE/ParE family toxin [Chthoniobacterales bacterium]|nr:type II toxin-antitoxin system RelE/ParE family toxin [Chthoniobacterales bacterium]
MSYKIELAPKAHRQLRKLSPSVQKQIHQILEQLAQDPRPPHCKKMQAVGTWRVRTGKYRVIYEINDGILLILVLALGHRKEVYRNWQ